MMKASYKKLWKLLVDKEMSKSDLHKATSLSSSTMTKLRRSEDVSMEALRKICIVLDCNIADIATIPEDYIYRIVSQRDAQGRVKSRERNNLEYKESFGLSS